MKDPYSIIKNPVSTEKAVRLMESENKLLFAVNKEANKRQIKEAALRRQYIRSKREYLQKIGQLPSDDQAAASTYKQGSSPQTNRR